MMILGIDAENVRRLKDGRPIVKALSQFGGRDDILIIYGDTIEDIRLDLEKSLGPLPPSKPLPEPQ